MHNVRRVVLVLSLALLLSGIVSGCQPPSTPSPAPTPSIPVTSTPTPVDELAEIRRACLAWSEAGRERQLAQPEYGGLVYIDGYAIVAGPQEEIDKVVHILELPLVPAEGASDIDFGSWSKYEPVEDAIEFLTEKQGHLPLDLNELSETTMRLYQIFDGKSVEQVVCEINKFSARDGLAVFAEPDYHVSPADNWAGGGSPWTQNGEWVNGLDGGGLSEAPGGDFRSQWAFGSGGIDLPDREGDRTSDGYAGEGVRIGIFDTSPPFTRVKEHYTFRELGGDALGALADAGPPLTVWYQELRPAPNCPGYNRNSEEEESLESQDISNHGLFVAGLAHAVAPQSEIYLVRVLENDGCGDLFGINEGIQRFISQTLEAKGTLRGTVLNLSLGVHTPPSPEKFGLPEEVKSLEYILAEAVSLGAVVVAAAGNDSFDKLPPVPPNEMEIPAQYPFVVGVAASNNENDRGCFSNRGDVAAPGGDGEFADGETPCVLPNCLADPNLCVISLAPNSPTGYAYWVGTSFATPLVSGQAALLLEEGTPPGQVSDDIQAHAAPTPPDLYLGSGIIHVR